MSELAAIGPQASIDGQAQAFKPGTMKLELTLLRRRTLASDARSKLSSACKTSIKLTTPFWYAANEAARA